MVAMARSEEASCDGRLPGSTPGVKHSSLLDRGFFEGAVWGPVSPQPPVGEVLRRLGLSSPKARNRKNEMGLLAT